MSAPIYTLTDSEGKPRNFSLGKMPARTSFTVRIRLIKMLGEPLFRLFAGGKVAALLGGKGAAAATAEAPKEGEGEPAPGEPENGVDLKGVWGTIAADPDAIGYALRTLASLVNPDDLLNIADTVFASCKCNGKQMDGAMFDATFTTLHPGAVEQVLIAALKENYQNFFGAGS